MNKYLIVPVNSMYEYDVYFNRKRKQGYRAKKSFLNFVILEHVKDVEGKYVKYSEENGRIENILNFKDSKLGYTLDNNIQSEKIIETKNNNRDLMIKSFVSLILSATLVYFILTMTTETTYLPFVVLEALLINVGMYGFNSIVELIKLMRKKILPITRFDTARKSIQFLTIIFSIIFIAMVLIIENSLVTEKSVVVLFMGALAVFILVTGYFIIKLSDNVVQGVSMVIFSAIIMFIFQSLLFAQIFMQIVRQTMGK